MKTIETVKANIYDIFENFETGMITSREMCDKLDTLLKRKGKKSYWFRFFKNDTIANDANSVRNSIQTIQNWQFLRENIQIALKERELQVYYS